MQILITCTNNHGIESLSCPGCKLWNFLQDNLRGLNLLNVLEKSNYVGPGRVSDMVSSIN